MRTRTRNRGYQIIRERPDLWLAHCGHPKHGIHVGHDRRTVEDRVRYHIKVTHRRPPL